MRNKTRRFLYKPNDAVMEMRGKEKRMKAPVTQLSNSLCVGVYVRAIRDTRARLNVMKNRQRVI